MITLKNYINSISRLVKWIKKESVDAEKSSTVLIEDKLFDESLG